MELNFFITAVRNKEYHTPQRIVVVNAAIKDLKTDTIPITTTLIFPFGCQKNQMHLENQCGFL